MKIAYIDRSFVCFFASYRINYFQQFLNLKFFSLSVLLTFGIRSHWRSLLIQLTQIFFRREVRKRKTWSKLIIKSVDKKGECVTMDVCVCVLFAHLLFSFWMNSSYHTICLIYFFPLNHASCSLILPPFTIKFNFHNNSNIVLNFIMVWLLNPTIDMWMY